MVVVCLEGGGRVGTSSGSIVSKSGWGKYSGIWIFRSRGRIENTERGRGKAFKIKRTAAVKIDSDGNESRQTRFSWIYRVRLGSLISSRVTLGFVIVLSTAELWAWSPWEFSGFAKWSLRTLFSDVILIVCEIIILSLIIFLFFFILVYGCN